MSETITIIDDRTGKQITVPITGGVFPASAVRELDPSLYIYDPAYMQTAACKSAITYLDGENGILRYRGYPIEQLAEKSTYLEVAYLLLNGELPDSKQLATWKNEVTHHTYIHENMRKRFVDGFHYDAHPMGMFVSSLAALGTFYNDAKDIEDKASRDKQILRMVAKTPTLAAMAYRFSAGLPFVYPDNDLSFPGNFLNMMWKVGDYHIDPRLERAMDVLFILHADHEQNASTSTVRLCGSSGTNPFAAIAAGVACLWGPAHGGANEACLNMLEDIQKMGGVAKVGEFMNQVKDKNSNVKLMGFGHRVYKNYDPRAKLMQETCNEVLQELGLENDPLFKLAKALEKIALEDDYFVSRKLYPNVDFYSGIVQRAIGIPVNLFTGIFALARTVGWIAQLNEMIGDPEYKIGRPRQLFTGADRRDVLPLAKR